MKNRTVSALTAVVIATALMVPLAQAQRGRSGGSGGYASRGSSSPQMSRSAPARPTITSTPSTPILPMTNPVAPMTNPVAPFVRYGGIPTVVYPPNQPVHLPGPYRGHYNNATVVVGGGYYAPYYPYYPYDPFYPYPAPYMYPPPIAGQLPNTYPYPPLDPPDPAAIEPDSGATPEGPVLLYEPESQFFVEPNMIITAPVPDRTVQPPAIGTSKADLLARYGQPWGSVRVQAKETLYFSGGLELVLENGRVTEVR